MPGKTSQTVLPLSAYFVATQGWVVCQEHHSLDLSLCHQHPVEGVPMVLRKAGGCLGVSGCHRQLGEAVRLDLRHQVGPNPVNRSKPYCES